MSTEKTDNIDQTEETTDTSTAIPVVTIHPTHRCWTFWYDLPVKAKSRGGSNASWETRLKLINSFHTVEEFWGFFILLTLIFSNYFLPSFLQAFLTLLKTVVMCKATSTYLLRASSQCGRTRPTSMEVSGCFKLQGAKKKGVVATIRMAMLMLLHRTIVTLNYG
jgi:hypothetical protein